MPLLYACKGSYIKVKENKDMCVIIFYSIPAKSKSKKEE